MGIGSEKLHSEEDVIGPGIICGNNHDPLQEMVIKGEGKGGAEEENHLLIVNVCTWLLLHKHSLGSGQCAWSHLALGSQGHSFASFRVDQQAAPIEN